MKGKLIKEKKDSTLKCPEAEFTVIKSADGLFDLPIRLIKPANMEAGKVYPVLLSVYGGPNHLQVREGFPVTCSEQSKFMCENGVIQAWIDHRGSGHNGKVGQNYMHRNLGYWEMEDYKQCVKWLIDNAQADAGKVMMTGFSYGGYITAYALTYGADVFTHGIAGGSVIDWVLYDAIYTERYMDTPEENPEGYKSASVLTHADKLKGRLLLTHGLRDENVHVQNTYQLVNLLQNKGKDFELMVYPESRHGYRGAKRDFSQQEDRSFIYRYLLEE